MDSRKQVELQDENKSLAERILSRGNKLEELLNDDVSSVAFTAVYEIFGKSVSPVEFILLMRKHGRNLRKDPSFKALVKGSVAKFAEFTQPEKTDPPNYKQFFGETDIANMLKRAGVKYPVVGYVSPGTKEGTLNVYFQEDNMTQKFEVIVPDYTKAIHSTPLYRPKNWFGHYETPSLTLSSYLAFAQRKDPNLYNTVDFMSTFNELKKLVLNNVVGSGTLEGLQGRLEAAQKIHSQSGWSPKARKVLAAWPLKDSDISFSVWSRLMRQDKIAREMLDEARFKPIIGHIKVRTDKPNKEKERHIKDNLYERKIELDPVVSKKDFKTFLTRLFKLSQKAKNDTKYDFDLIYPDDSFYSLLEIGINKMNDISRAGAVEGPNFMKYLAALEPIFPLSGMKYVLSDKLQLLYHYYHGNFSDTFTNDITKIIQKKVPQFKYPPNLTLIRMNLNATSGLFYGEKNKFVAHDLMAAAQQLLNIFSSLEPKKLENKRVYAKFMQLLDFLRHAKAVPKIEIYSLEKWIKKTRFIYAPENFAFMLLQIVLQTILKSQPKFPHNKGVLYPFTPATGFWYKIKDFIKDPLSKITRHNVHFLVYSDNIYLAVIDIEMRDKKPVKVVHWYSLDGSTAEASVTKALVNLEALRILSSCGYHSKESHNRDFFESILDDPNAASRLLGLISDEKRVMISKSWVLVVVLLLNLSVEMIGVLGKKRFKIPGMASGVAPTFYLNTTQMSLACGLSLQFAQNTRVEHGDRARLVIESAKNIGVKLKQELYSTFPLEPELARGQDLASFQLIKLDLLGFDLANLRLNFKDETRDKTLQIFVLDRERLMKAMLFSKSQSQMSIMDAMQENPLASAYLSLLLQFIRLKTLYVVGGWFYSDLAILIRAICNTLYTEFAGDSEKRITDEEVERNLSSFLGLMEIDATHVADLTLTLSKLDRKSLPSFAEVIRIMGSPADARIYDAWVKDLGDQVPLTDGVKQLLTQMAKETKKVETIVDPFDDSVPTELDPDLSIILDDFRGGSLPVVSPLETTEQDLNRRRLVAGVYPTRVIKDYKSAAMTAIQKFISDLDPDEDNLLHRFGNYSSVPSGNRTGTSASVFENILADHIMTLVKGRTHIDDKDVSFKNLPNLKFYFLEVLRPFIPKLSEFKFQFRKKEA